MKTSSKAKDVKFPPVRLSETGKETFVFPAKNHNQTLIFQQGDPIIESRLPEVFKTEKMKNPAGWQAFFLRNLHFFAEFFTFLLDSMILGVFLALEAFELVKFDEHGVGQGRGKRKTAAVELGLCEWETVSLWGCLKHSFGHRSGLSRRAGRRPKFLCFLLV